MMIQDCKQYVGRNCLVTYRDRLGNEQTKALHVHDLTFVPLYGAYLVGDVEDVHLEKVTDIREL